MDGPRTSNNFQTYLSLVSRKVDCDSLYSTDPGYLLAHCTEKMDRSEEDPAKEFLGQGDIIVPSSPLGREFFLLPIRGGCIQAPRCPFYSKSEVRRQGVLEHGNWTFLGSNGWIERLWMLPRRIPRNL